MGEGEKRERGKKGKRESPSFFPSSLSPTPFDACYTGWLMLNTISTMLAFLFAVGVPETLGILQIAPAIAIYLRQLYITNNTTKHCRTLYCNLEKEKKRGRKRERKKDELRELKQSIVLSEVNKLTLSALFSLYVFQVTACDEI